MPLHFAKLHIVLVFFYCMCKGMFIELSTKNDTFFLHIFCSHMFTLINLTGWLSAVAGSPCSCQDIPENIVGVISGNVKILSPSSVMIQFHCCQVQLWNWYNLQIKINGIMSKGTQRL